MCHPPACTASEYCNCLRKDKSSTGNFHRTDPDQRTKRIGSCIYLESGQQVREGRSDEVVIGGFGLNSKEGAIQLVQQIIEGKYGEPFIFKDKTSLTPKVVSVTFNSRDYAETFVRQHADKNNFAYRYEGFWCGMSQTPEEQPKFQNNLCHSSK